MFFETACFCVTERLLAALNSKQLFRTRTGHHYQEMFKTFIFKQIAVKSIWDIFFWITSTCFCLYTCEINLNHFLSICRRTHTCRLIHST